MLDLLRVQGCFALSAQYAMCFMMGDGSTCFKPTDPKLVYPVVKTYEAIGAVFEKALAKYLQEESIDLLEEISCGDHEREQLENKTQC